ncbi:diguanylate cyclase [Echinicola strongylocentroti]|uniref:histidine kinase n=1 Tax=Echinicola strongylocentroti TaxID=1795355 RepID=A0A2Z4IH55_9BACT|nr:PAS domain-containing protein [Echinicola strongylocentroti]AWW30491.1 diguanylate cyclase [Echinicola strongylocentroti]
MFEDINLFYIAISLIPALFNVAIFGYIFWIYPSNRETNIFLLFVVSLVVWQLQDTLMRLNIDYDMACHISRSLDFGWMFIGAVILHFVSYYTDQPFIKSRFFLIAIYGISAVLYVVYLANLDEVILSYDENWGYITGVRPGSYDLHSRGWVALLAMMGLAVLLYSAFDKRHSPIMKRQILVLFLGAVLPVIQGVVTQFYFSSQGLTDIPVTSTTLTSFSVAAVIALRKYKLFDVSSYIAAGKIVKQIENGMMVLSPENKIIYLNPSACELFDVDKHKGDFGSLPVFFDSEAKYQNFLKNVNSQLANKDRESGSAQLMAKDGKQLQVLFRASTFYYSRGKRGTLIIFNDITALQQANHVIKMIDMRYDFVAKASDEAVWEWSFESKSIYWNENYEGLFGYKLASGTSSIEHWVDRIHSDDRERVLKGMEQHVLSKKKSRWEVEYRYQKNDGSYAHVFDKGFVIYNEKGVATRMVGTMQDLTKIKSYIEKIERQNQELSAITWMQSHEFRAPLSRLMGLVECVKGFGVDEEVDAKFLEEIEASCVELDQIVHKIVDRVGKVSTG